MIVTKKACDVCGSTTENPNKFALWGSYRDIMGQIYEVCRKCENRLFRRQGK